MDQAAAAAAAAASNMNETAPVKEETVLDPSTTIVEKVETEDEPNKSGNEMEEGSEASSSSEEESDSDDDSDDVDSVNEDEIITEKNAEVQDIALGLQDMSGPTTENELPFLDSVLKLDALPEALSADEPIEPACRVMNSKMWPGAHMAIGQFKPNMMAGIEPVTGIASMPVSTVLDEGSVLCTAERKLVGRVYDVFGPVAAPLYSIVLLGDYAAISVPKVSNSKPAVTSLESAEDVESPDVQSTEDSVTVPVSATDADAAAGTDVNAENDSAAEVVTNVDQPDTPTAVACTLKEGDILYCVPKHANKVDTTKLNTRGSDASNLYNEEAGGEEQDFSDDEQEEAARRQAKEQRRQKRRPAESDTSRQSNNNSRQQRDERRGRAGERPGVASGRPVQPLRPAYVTPLIPQVHGGGGMAQQQQHQQRGAPMQHQPMPPQGFAGPPSAYFSHQQPPFQLQQQQASMWQQQQSQILPLHQQHHQQQQQYQQQQQHQPMMPPQHHQQQQQPTASQLSQAPPMPSGQAQPTQEQWAAYYWYWQQQQQNQ